MGWGLRLPFAKPPRIAPSVANTWNSNATIAVRNRGDQPAKFTATMVIASQDVPHPWVHHGERLTLAWTKLSEDKVVAESVTIPGEGAASIRIAEVVIQDNPERTACLYITYFGNGVDWRRYIIGEWSMRDKNPALPRATLDVTISCRPRPEEDRRLLCAVTCNRRGEIMTRMTMK